MNKSEAAKCYQLAKELLENRGETHSSTIEDLAERIQDTIDDFIAELE